MVDAPIFQPLIASAMSTVFKWFCYFFTTTIIDMFQKIFVKSLFCTKTLQAADNKSTKDSQNNGENSVTMCG